ncbi:hypothetical protein XELAEV_18027949mg [Xenopus laevis]|uniref:KY-like immunoglobulin-like domain-containing protein n=1 Tax=Xenopus laevis TaxID=8355 RepID=A0A974HKP2_XENLA|nr:hypothetical protein XELAEV_18027949mg [Xenopus laevis]
MVYLEESWHLLDSTWGAGTVSYNGPFTFGYNEFYFLTHPALFIEDHFPEENEHQLLEPCVSLEQFEKLNRKCYFYKIGLLSSLPDTVTVETVKGKVTFTLEGRHHFQFLFHLNKTETPGLMQLTEHGMKLDVYPQKTGEQILQIFGKERLENRSQREDTEGSYDWIIDYKIQCRTGPPGYQENSRFLVGPLVFQSDTDKIICKSGDTNMNIPKCLHNPVGHSWLSEKARLFQPSHQISTPILFHQNIYIINQYTSICIFGTSRKLLLLKGELEDRQFPSISEHGQLSQTGKLHQLRMRRHADLPVSLPNTRKMAAWNLAA